MYVQNSKYVLEIILTKLFQAKTNLDSYGRKIKQIDLEFELSVSIIEDKPDHIDSFQECGIQ